MFKSFQRENRPSYFIEQKKKAEHNFQQLMDFNTRLHSVVKKIYDATNEFTKSLRGIYSELHGLNNNDSPVLKQTFELLIPQIESIGKIFGFIKQKNLPFDDIFP